MDTLQDRLRAHGFRLEGTGGNCTAWVRQNGTAEELVTDGDGRASQDDDVAYLSVETFAGTRYYLWDTLGAFCDHLDAHGGDLTEENCDQFNMTEVDPT